MFYNFIDVTANVMQIPHIPKTISTWIDDGKIPQYVEVRGEIFISTSDFVAINKNRLENGLVSYSTARNAASGNLRRLDNPTNILESLNFFAYNIRFSTLEGIHKEVLSFDQRKTLNVLKSLNFNVAEFCTGSINNTFSLRPCMNALKELSNGNNTENEKETKKKALEFQKLNLVNSLFSSCDISPTDRMKLEYSIDGVVIKVDSFALQNLLGFSLRTPKWAIAFKLPAEEGFTKLLDIKVQVGRTGVLTPVAILEPITLGGVVIERATLHNEDEVNRLRLSPGKRVRLIRSGDVIPKILGCVEVNQEVTNSYSLPCRCPSCGGSTAKEALISGGDRVESIVVRCTNSYLCPAQAIQGIKHYTSREAVDIKGLGGTSIEELYNDGFIQSIVDIYQLERKNRERDPDLRLVIIFIKCAPISYTF